MRRTLLGFFLICTAIASHAQSSHAQSSPQTVQDKLGYPANARLLIIHADDFGMAHSVNTATIEALEHKWITSASILVPCPWFPEVATWAKAHPDSDLGIHLALNSEWTTFRWGPLSGASKVPSLLDKDGYLPLVEGQVVSNAKPDEIETELRTQIQRAENAGIHLTHLDSHMGTLMKTPEFLTRYQKMGREFTLPVLLEKAAGVHGANAEVQKAVTAPVLIDEVIEINPGIDAAGWTAWYEQTLAPLKPGVYQLIVHLGHDDDELRGATADHPNWGATWRQNDVNMVKSAEFQKFLKDQNFILIGWKDLAKAAPIPLPVVARPSR
jgi:predicted glycoside hydrolase/deacetylase ChbG (UPF0249 family)